MTSTALPRFVVACENDDRGISIGLVEWNIGHPGFVIVRWGAEVSVSPDDLMTAELLPVSALVGMRLCDPYCLAKDILDGAYKRRYDRLEKEAQDKPPGEPAS